MSSTSATEMRRYVVLDVFTATPLEGNQLGVFLDGSGLDDRTMQRTARELNLSETVFVLPPQDGGDVRVRIFTPASELPFAGHPVLGTAFVVGETRGEDRVRLETGAGVVPIALERDGGCFAFGRMEQPIPTWEPFERERELLAALRIAGSQLPVEVYCNGPHHVYVVLPDEKAVASLRPDLGAVADVGEVGVSCVAGSGTRWKSRMFAPGLGVAEDPATGSAAGPLALHLARHGLIPFGQEIEIRQGVEIGRPSLLYARAVGSADAVERIEVGGSAVVVARGEYRLA